MDSIRMLNNLKERPSYFHSAHTNIYEVLFVIGKGKNKGERERQTRKRERRTKNRETTKLLRKSNIYRFQGRSLKQENSSYVSSSNRELISFHGREAAVEKACH